MMIGVFIENEFIVFCVLFVFFIDDEYLGFDIGLLESELYCVIY